MRGEDYFRCDTNNGVVMRDGAQARVGLYFHIPFCRRKCGYCDFTSFADYTAIPSSYLEVLTREFADQACHLPAPLTSVYVGGGTPSLLNPSQLMVLMDTVRMRMGSTETVEVSIEANPETTSQQWLESGLAVGFNRLSFGLQSMDNDVLMVLGRGHTAEQACLVFELARHIGWKNISIDLLYGCPNQSTQSWVDTLNRVMELHPEHISLYALTPYPHTLLTKMVCAGKQHLPCDEQVAQQYLLAVEMLEASGYFLYEVSNTAQTGFECQHNLTYWHRQPYLGCGVGAHTCLQPNIRIWNTDCLEIYLQAFSGDWDRPFRQQEHLTTEEMFEEELMLGLRLRSGLDMRAFLFQDHGTFPPSWESFWKELQAAGHAWRQKYRWGLHPKGMLMADEIVAELLVRMDRAELKN